MAVGVVAHTGVDIEFGTIRLGFEPASLRGEAANWPRSFFAVAASASGKSAGTASWATIGWTRQCFSSITDLR
jgi:hypothetical protein